jgi:hypothetical protein
VGGKLNHLYEEKLNNQGSLMKIVEDNGSIQYHAYAKTKGHRVIALTWDEVCIIKTTVESLFSNKPAWRKIDSKALADKFMAVCADIWPEDFTNESEDTNEIVVDCTNDATAGCDDLDL